MEDEKEDNPGSNRERIRTLLYKAYRIRSRQSGNEAPECFTWNSAAFPIERHFSWGEFRASLIDWLAPIAPRIRRLEFRSYSSGMTLYFILNDEREFLAGYTAAT